MRSLRTAATIFAAHGLLLFLPPLPPVHKGSLWSWLLGYTSVVLALRGYREWGPRLIDWWTARPAPTRYRQVGLALAGLAGVGLAMRTAVPDTFARFGREEGVWEPITLLCYSASALILFEAARREAGPDRRHLQLVGAGFGFLTLEEVDYFGIFGGIIGRVEGVYVGTLHDLIGLAGAGALPTVLAAAMGAVALVGVWWLVRAGFIQPMRLGRLARSFDAVWLVSGFALLFFAAAEEGGLLWFRFAPPTLEEFIEVIGAIFLAGFALQTRASVETRAADQTRPGTPDVNPPPGTSVPTPR